MFISQSISHPATLYRHTLQGMTFRLTDAQEQRVREWARAAKEGAVWVDDKGVTATIESRDDLFSDVLIVIKHNGVTKCFITLQIEDLDCG